MRPLIPVAMLTAACAMPLILDLDGSPVTRPALIATIEGGWLVLDSSRGQARAIVEVETTSGGEPWREFAAPGLRLQLEDGDWLRPARVLLDTERCPGFEARTAYCLNRPTGDPFCGAPAWAVTQPCSRRLRAEFALPSLPSAPTSLVLALGDRALRLQWMVPRSASVRLVGQ